MLNINKLAIKIFTDISIIKNLSFKIISQFLLREERRFNKNIAAALLENENFIKAVIIISFEMILFIENCIELNVFEIMSFVKLDPYEFWKIINPFYKFDGLIPSVIKSHFQAIENQIFSFLIWQKDNKFKSTISDFFKKNTIEISDFEVVSSPSGDTKDYEKLEFDNQSLFVYQ